MDMEKRNDRYVFTYDAIGNPLSYYNGQSYTFTWENGRQLANAIPSDTLNTGIGYGQPGAEFHCGWGYTKTLYSINIFDVTKNIYKNFKER